MVLIRILPRAEKDLFALSEKIRNEAMSKIELLRDFPELGQQMGESYKAYRCLLLEKGNYRLIYKIKNSSLIEIAYIRHCRRQMGLRVVQ